MAQTRGIRNKNPFNIKRGSSQWIGKVPFSKSTDLYFEQFWTMDLGLRAGIILLQNYLKQGCCTLGNIIYRFAPPSDNDSKAYWYYVSEYMHVDLYADIDNIDYFYLLCAAICEYESHYTLFRSHFDTILQTYNIHLKFDF